MDRELEAIALLPKAEREAVLALYLYQDEMKRLHCGSTAVSMAAVWERMSDEERERENALCRAAGFREW